MFRRFKLWMLRREAIRAPEVSFWESVKVPQIAFEGEQLIRALNAVPRSMQNEVKPYDSSDPWAEVRKLQRGAEDAAGTPFVRFLEFFEKNATLPDAETCRVIEDAFRRLPPENRPSAMVGKVLDIACELPSDHPGWRILSLFAEYLMGEGSVQSIGKLKRRLEAGEFEEMLPFAAIVWIECRLRTRTPSNEDTTFPPHWKDIVHTAIESVACPGDIDYRTKSTLPGKIAMAFSEITQSSIPCY